MELSLSTALDRNTLHLGLTGSSQAVVGSTAAYEQEVVLWATTAFTYAIALTPVAQKPVAGTPGDRTWPAGIPLRVRVPKGFSIAALALSGTGDFYAMPEA